MTIRRSFRRVAMLLACAVFVCDPGCDRKPSAGMAGPQSGAGQAGRAAVWPDLAAERAKHPTRHTTEPQSPQKYVNEEPSDGARVVTFQSGDLRLSAWVGGPRPAAGADQKHPALVYLHGGFAFGADDWAETQPYRDAGYVVMTPTLRGENGNPGHFEMFYGEVDDAVAAGRYLAALPEVDPARVYVAGHSSGAAETILASLVASPFAAATSIGGYVDMANVTAYEPVARIAPFDVADPDEMRLRSAKHFAGTLRCPLYLMCGTEDEPALAGAAEFAAAARAAGRTCELLTLPGDHHSSKTAAIRKSIELFARHGGPTPR
ncbi:MAG: hypothetical protein JWO31_3920 [Phycisphaerales bacterium]|nr:hypothetical protein [Phycisphaerales bacterium]